MSVADKFTEITDTDVKGALKDWALERVSDEVAMFREALRLFVQMTFVANAAAAVSVATVLFDRKFEPGVTILAMVSLFSFLVGLLAGLVFGLALMKSLNTCREKYLKEAPRLYFSGLLTHADYAHFHSESRGERTVMSAAAAVALIAFVFGILTAAFGMIRVWMGF